MIRMQLAVLALVSAFLAGPLPLPRAPAPAPAADRAQSHAITWDQHSLRIDGRPTFLWSGEFHYWRQPDPAAWLDVMQKLKAAGFNTVSIYFDWGYHSPAPGVYDFTGVRDVDRVLATAAQVGLYVIARPGPYINAEADGGGFPAWLAREKVVPRTNDPAYVAFATEWLSHVDPIIARHQLSNGTGTVVLYQVENEFHNDSAQAEAYMQALEDRAHADGITVPTNTNETGWAFGNGAVQVPGAVDEYPLGFNCSNPATWPRGVPTLRRDDAARPLMVFEYGSGAFDPWGGAGYASCAQLTSASYENVFYKDALAQGVTGINFYMAAGGTSWGWLPTTRVYSSYDYGAPVGESRQLTDKYDQMKREAYLVGAVPALTTSDLVGRGTLATDPAVHQYVRADAATGTQLYFLRHTDATSTAVDAVHIAVQTADGSYPSVPQGPGTAIVLDGRDSKVLVADHDLRAAHLVYSTSELMTEAAGATDTALLYGPSGQAGETVLRYGAQPAVRVLAGSVTSTWDPARGDLRLNYTHGGMARVSVSQGGRTLLLLIADTQTSARSWLDATSAGPVLTTGPYLVRTAATRDETLALTGDTDAATALEVFAPRSVRRVTWNGREVEVRRTASGSLAGRLPGPEEVSLPALTGWRFQAESPEASPSFDDSSWIAAAGASLDEDLYGFHHGDVWYRGHFTATGAETGVTLDGEGGAPGIFSAWLNGALLGTLPSGSHALTFPAGALRAGQDNVISVLVMNMGHEECRPPCGPFFNARGLRSAAVQGSTTALSWRLQGNAGGESASSPRGPLNTGGLFGERSGWYLPGFDARGWKGAALPDSWAARGVPAGIGWYRTTFSLRVPRGTDAPLGLRIQDDPSRRYRAQIFLNGWMVGIYANDLGPQHVFSLPLGLVNTRGTNTIAIAVWGEDAASGGLGQVSLVPTGVLTRSDSRVTVTFDRD
jgi:beta-galactosidase GanA